jgi:hypothetical protein
MTRMIEILALGSGLRAEAARECGCLNESYFLVHQVLARAFVDDPDLTASGALHEQLSGRLQSTLITSGAPISL